MNLHWCAYSWARPSASECWSV